MPVGLHGLPMDMVFALVVVVGGAFLLIRASYASADKKAAAAQWRAEQVLADHERVEAQIIAALKNRGYLTWPWVRDACLPDIARTAEEFTGDPVLGPYLKDEVPYVRMRDVEATLEKMCLHLLLLDRFTAEITCNPRQLTIRVQSNLVYDAMESEGLAPALKRLLGELPIGYSFMDLAYEPKPPGFRGD